MTLSFSDAIKMNSFHVSEEEGTYIRHLLNHVGDQKHPEIARETINSVYEADPNKYERVSTMTSLELRLRAFSFFQSAVKNHWLSRQDLQRMNDPENDPVIASILNYRVKDNGRSINWSGYYADPDDQVDDSQDRLQRLDHTLATKAPGAYMDIIAEYMELLSTQPTMSSSDSDKSFLRTSGQSAVEEVSSEVNQSLEEQNQNPTYAPKYTSDNNGRRQMQIDMSGERIDTLDHFTDVLTNIVPMKTRMKLMSQLDASQMVTSYDSLVIFRGMIDSIRSMGYTFDLQANRLHNGVVAYVRNGGVSYSVDVLRTVNLKKAVSPDELLQMQTRYQKALQNTADENARGSIQQRLNAINHAVDNGINDASIFRKVPELHQLAFDKLVVTNAHLGAGIYQGRNVSRPMSLSQLHISDSETNKKLSVIQGDFLKQADSNRRGQYDDSGNKKGAFTDYGLKAAYMIQAINSRDRVNYLLESFRALMGTEPAKIGGSVKLTDSETHEKKDMYQVSLAKTRSALKSYQDEGYVAPDGLTHILTLHSGSQVTLYDRASNEKTLKKALGIKEDHSDIIVDLVARVNAEINDNNMTVLRENGYGQIGDDFNLDDLPDDIKEQLEAPMNIPSVKDGYAGLDVQTLYDHDVRPEDIARGLIEAVDEHQVSNKTGDGLFRGIAFDSFNGEEAAKQHLMDYLAGHGLTRDDVKNYDELGAIQEASVMSTIASLLESGVRIQDKYGNYFDDSSVLDPSHKPVKDIRDFYGYDAAVYFDKDNTIQWTGQKPKLTAVTDLDSQGQPIFKDDDYETVHGMIGQIFDYEQAGRFKNNVLDINLLGSDSIKMVPGYQAYFMAADDKVPLAERLRLRDYSVAVSQMVNSTVRSQVLTDSFDELDGFQKGYSLYRSDSYGLRLTPEMMKRDNIMDVVVTNRRRVLFDEASMSDVTPENSGEDAANNHGITPTLRHNIKALEPIFDIHGTSDGAKYNLVRYLSASVDHVDTRGVVKMVDDPEKTQLLYANATPGIMQELMRRGAYGDAKDRVMMASQNLNHGLSTDDTPHVAHMTYRGLTKEDGVVISKDYADRFKERTGRELHIQDKFSDFHGNKGTISAIVDPESSDGWLFKKNPKLDVIMSPVSLISRDNYGTVIEAQMNNDFVPIYGKNDEVLTHAARIGLIESDAKSDHKVQLYEDQYDDNGDLVKKANRGGRKFGNQQEWITEASGLHNLIKEVYQNPGVARATSELRAYMNVDDMDFDVHGRMRVSNGEDVRNQIPHSDGRDAAGIAAFDKGGYLDLPKGLTINSAVTGKPISSIYVVPEKMRQGQVSVDGRLLKHDYQERYERLMEQVGRLHDSYDQANTLKDLIADAKENKEGWQKRAVDFYAQQGLHGWLVGKKSDEVDAEGNPVRKPWTDEEFIQHLQSKQKMAENNLNLDYVSAKGKQAGSTSQASTIQKVARQTHALQEAVMTEHLGGHGDVSKDNMAVKRSLVKREILGTELKANHIPSATAGVSNDASLPLDTIAISPDMEKHLRLKDRTKEGKENDVIGLWRDPALHDGSFRAFKYQVKDNLNGIAINPEVTDTFGMDFDGDTVALIHPRKKETQDELKSKAMIWDKIFDTTSGELDLNLGVDSVLDYQKAFEKGTWPEAGKREEIAKRDPEPQGNTPEAEVEKSKLWKTRLKDTLTDYAKAGDWNKFNEFSQQVISGDDSIGNGVLDLQSKESVENSLKDLVSRGAKGKMKYDEATNTAHFPEIEKGMHIYDRGLKLTKYSAEVASNDSELNALDSNKLDNFKQLDREYKDDAAEVTQAQSAKNELTPKAGAKSQQLVSLNYDRKEGQVNSTELTEPLTQATVQLKHNAEDVPRINSLQQDYSKMLENGGKDKVSFVAWFNKDLLTDKEKVQYESEVAERKRNLAANHRKAVVKDNYYADSGLDISRKILDNVYDSLAIPVDSYHQFVHQTTENYDNNQSKRISVRSIPLTDENRKIYEKSVEAGQSKETVAAPVKVQIVDNVSPLIRASLYGGDELVRAAKNNEVLGEPQAETLKETEHNSEAHLTYVKQAAAEDNFELSLTKNILQKENVSKDVSDDVFAQSRLDSEQIEEGILNRKLRNEQVEDTKHSIQDEKQTQADTEFSPSFTAEDEDMMMNAPIAPADDEEQIEEKPAEQVASPVEDKGIAEVAESASNEDIFDDPANAKVTEMDDTQSAQVPQKDEANNGYSEEELDALSRPQAGYDTLKPVHGKAISQSRSADDQDGLDL